MTNLHHNMLNNIYASNVTVKHSEDNPIEYPLYVRMYNRITEAIRNNANPFSRAVIDTETYSDHVQISWRENSGRYEIIVTQRVIDEFLEVFKERGFGIEIKPGSIILSW